MTVISIPEKGTMEYGAWNALYHGLKLEPGEKVVIVTDKEQQRIGDIFSEQARALSGDVRLFVMEDFGERPLTYLPEDIEKELSNVNITLYLAGTREGELAFRRPMIRTAVGHGARHGHGVGINEEIMLTGMQADIPESNRLCREIGERLEGISWARVTSDLGTDMTLEFHPDVKWLVSDWDFTKKWHNIPSGEVFTWPYRTNGSYIVDGVLGDHFDGKYGSLQRTPVIISRKRQSHS